VHPAEVETCLEELVCIVDSREQDTVKLRSRIRSIGYPIERAALNVGDYSAKIKLPNGEWYQIPVAIERKYAIDELCMCYCQERGRFEREFKRAQEAHIQVYLLVEGATWESIYSGKYRSQMRPKSLVASICSWLARYNCKLIFCKSETTGAVIRDILYYEAREILLKMEDRPNE